MATVLNEEKKQQVLALGRLGWPLRRIQQATRIRRETASGYLKAAGIAVRPPSAQEKEYRSTESGHEQERTLRRSAIHPIADGRVARHFAIHHACGMISINILIAVRVTAGRWDGRRLADKGLHHLRPRRPASTTQGPCEPQQGRRMSSPTGS